MVSSKAIVTAREQAITQLYSAQPFGLVYVAAGGGSRLVDWLHSVPGASSMMLASYVPYSYEAVKSRMASSDRSTDLLIKSVSHGTCVSLLDWAMFDASMFKTEGQPAAAALVVTAALATNRERRGVDQAWCGFQIEGQAPSFWHEQYDRALGRDKQEERLSNALLTTLLNKGGITSAR